MSERAAVEIVEQLAAENARLRAALRQVREFVAGEAQARIDFLCQAQFGAVWNCDERDARVAQSALAVIDAALGGGE